MNITIDIEVPQALYDAGAIELFAKNFGWNEDSEITAFEHGKKQLQNYILQHAKKQFKMEQSLKSDEMFNSLITE